MSVEVLGTGVHRKAEKPRIIEGVWLDETAFIPTVEEVSVPDEHAVTTEQVRRIAKEVKGMASDRRRVDCLARLTGVYTYRRAVEPEEAEDSG